MPLPKINAPIFELTLPSTNEQIKYRPFLVKEQKILLLAMEGGDDVGITTAIKQIITNCSIDPVDVDKLPTFDVEYYFTRLRAKSIGEKVDLRMRHPFAKNKSGNECKHETGVSFNLLDLEVIKNENHSDTIVLDDETGIGVKMKYPVMNNNVTIEDSKTEIDLAAAAIINSIDYVFDKDNVYKREDSTRDELMEFIDNLSQAQFEKLAKFFQTMPKLKHAVSWKCKGCGEDETVELEGMSNFFAF